VTEKPNFHSFECPECAIRLGSIEWPRPSTIWEPQQAFMDMMREFISDILGEVVGVRPAWPNSPYPAPEHERAGNS
jgi:hypothetical protein